MNCGPYLGFAEVESTETIEQVDVGLHEATYELLWEAFPSFHDRRYYVKMTVKITDGPDQYHPSFGHVEVKNISCLEDRQTIPTKMRLSWLSSLAFSFARRPLHHGWSRA